MYLLFTYINGMLSLANHADILNNYLLLKIMMLKTRMKHFIYMLIYLNKYLFKFNLWICIEISNLWTTIVYWNHNCVSVVSWLFFCCLLISMIEYNKYVSITLSCKMSHHEHEIFLLNDCIIRYCDFILLVFFSISAVWWVIVSPKRLTIIHNENISSATVDQSKSMNFDMMKQNNAMFINYWFYLHKSKKSANQMSTSMPSDLIVFWSIIDGSNEVTFYIIDEYILHVWTKILYSNEVYDFEVKVKMHFSEIIVHLACIQYIKCIYYPVTNCGSNSAVSRNIFRIDESIQN